jgi:hypothetical protein
VAREAPAAKRGLDGGRGPGTRFCRRLGGC